MTLPTSTKPLHLHTNNPSLPLEWLSYTHTLTRNQNEITHLDSEVDRALIRISAEEHSITKNEFRKSKQLADKKRVLYEARNASARAQRRLDRLQNRVAEWDREKASPMTPVLEMQGRSAMDICGEIEECVGDALGEVRGVERGA